MRSPAKPFGTPEGHQGFWTYQAPAPLDYDDLPRGVFAGSRADWESLTPGMRREILRDHERRQRRG